MLADGELGADERLGELIDGQAGDREGVDPQPLGSGNITSSHGAILAA
jgi:hypothetical protein